MTIKQRRKLMLDKIQSDLEFYAEHEFGFAVSKYSTKDGSCIYGNREGFMCSIGRMMPLSVAIQIQEEGFGDVDGVIDALNRHLSGVVNYSFADEAKEHLKEYPIVFLVRIQRIHDKAANRYQHDEDAGWLQYTKGLEGLRRQVNTGKFDRSRLAIH